MSSRARTALLAAAAVILVVAFVIARGAGDGGGTRDAASTQPAGAGGGSGTGTLSAPSSQTTAGEVAPAKPAIPVVRVVGGQPQGDVRRLSFHHGDRIRFAVRSDTADEIHVHGYDLHQDVAAGGRVTFSFPAKIEGRFVVELEQHGTEIAQLEVQP